MSYDGSNGINCLDTENGLINPTVQRIFSGSYIRPISSVNLAKLKYSNIWIDTSSSPSIKFNYPNPG